MIKYLQQLFFVVFTLYSVQTFAQFPFYESFKNSTAKGVVLGGAPNPASLTAPLIDSEGEGYLRLTSNGGGQTGYMYCNSIFPSTKGFSVDFEYFTHGNVINPPGADGICFFLFDASANPFNIGAFGGALGYAQRYVVQENGDIIDLPGVSKGYIGIGLDEWGNFARQSEGRQGGIGYQTIHAVSLRGAGNGNALTPDNYPFLVTQKTEELPTTSFLINGRNRAATSPGINGYRKAIFEMEPRAGGGYFITVKIQFTENNTTNTATVINRYEYKTQAPPFLKFGFASSTGGTDNFHEIRNLNINLPSDANVPPPLAMDDNFLINQGDLSGAFLYDITSNDVKDASGSVDKASVDLEPEVPGIQTSKVVAGKGTFIVNASGQVTFIPLNATFAGSATITYTVDDLFSQMSNVANITVTINKKPVANDDSPAAFNQQSSKTFSVTDNDTDPEGNNTIATASIDLNPATPVADKTLTVPGEGTYTANDDGTVKFTPVDSFYGLTTPIKYTIKDSNGALSNEALISLTVIPLNFVPVAAKFDIHINEDSSSELIKVMEAASDADGNETLVKTSIDLDPSTPAVLDKTKSIANVGTFTVDDLTGTVTFVPIGDFFGVVPALAYTVRDDQGNISLPGSIKITVDNINDAPTAVDDTKTVDEDSGPTTFSITANDTDPDGNSTLKLSSIDLDPTTPAKDVIKTITGKGTLAANTDGTVTFTPALNFFGTFGPVTYTVEDDNSVTSNKASITITVNSVNDAPVAKNIDLVIEEGTSVTIAIPDYATDVENEIDPASVAFSGTHFLPDANGKVLVTPAGYNTVEFGYTIKDKDKAISNQANVKVRVNRIPVVQDYTLKVNSFQEGIVDIVKLITDDSPVIPANITLVQLPQHGNHYKGDDGKLSYSSVFDYFGQDKITYTVTDEFGSKSREATITILINRIPVARNDSKKYNLNQAVEVNIFANDEDDNNNRDVAIGNVTFTQPSSGKVETTTSGVLKFTPPVGYQGATAFTYFIVDEGKAQSGTATVSMIYNLPPVVSGVSKKVNMNVSGGSTINVVEIDFTNLVNDPDNDGIDWSSLLTGLTPRGTTRWEPNEKKLYYTPRNNLSGTETFTYTVQDLAGGKSNTGTINIAINGYPIANPDAAKVNLGETTLINVGLNDSDPEGFDIIPTIEIVSRGNGTPSLMGNGIIRYEANPIIYGNDTFTYRIKDNEGLTATATVTIKVNKPPTALPDNNPDGSPLKINEGESKTVSVAKNDTDNESVVPSSVTIVGLENMQQVGTTSVDGDVTVRPFDGFGGKTASFTYTIKDNDGAVSNQMKVDFIINSRPRAFDDRPSKRVPQGGSMEIDVLGTGTSTPDFDPDGILNPGSISIKTQGVKGTATLVNGKVLYTPNSANETGDDLFTYTVKDNDGFESLPATVYLRINAKPKALASQYNFELYETRTINLQATDDQFVDFTTVKIIRPPQFGTLSPVRFNGEFEYSAGTSARTDSFTFMVLDQDGEESNIATVTLIINPAPKIGLAKKLVSISKATNGTHNLKFLFTLVNYGTDQLNQVTLDDDLNAAFAGSVVKVTSLTASGSLVVNNAYNGVQDKELLSNVSSIPAGATATVELQINVALNKEKGSFSNSAAVRAVSARTGAQLRDVSQDGIKPDPNDDKDVTFSDNTEINLEKANQFIPGGFSPNNDGVNDKLVVENTGLNKISIEVFNRWGNRVFKSADYKNDWEGRCTEGIKLGEDIPDGTYYYILNIENTGRFVGYITVKR